MKLKPCPFCGRIPYITDWVNKSEKLGLRIAQLKCDCGSSGPERYGKDRVEKAFEVWNTRSQHETNAD